MNRTTILAFSLLLFCTASVRAETYRFAIVIGQNASDSPSIPDLRYADDDAVATHRMFTQAGIESVLLVALDDDSRGMHPDLENSTPPTRENLFKAFERLTGKMNEMKAGGTRGHGTQRRWEVEFLLVYSGHGNVEHGEGYIVLYNGGRLSRGDLYDEILARSPATRNHVIVDACKSYYLAFEKGPGGRRQPYDRHFVDRADASRFPNTGFLLSTSSDRDSHEWERFQAGVFSHELRSALRGGADVDGDSKITYAELGAFLTTANERIKNPRYRPDFAVHPAGGLSREIIDWTRNREVLVVDDTAWGHVYVESSSGERLLDIHPESGESFLLQLPADRPLFVRKADETRELVVEQPGPARVSALGPRSVQVGRKGALHLAFEELFAEPFGRTKLRAFNQRFAPAMEPAAVTLEEEAPSSAGSLVKTTAFWTAVGAAALGVSANIWAYERYSSGENASQSRRTELNRDIEKLNTAAVVFYSLAGAAAATWLTLLLWPDESGQGKEIEITPALGPDTIGLGLTIHLSP
jgi:hypothetical protein